MRKVMMKDVSENLTFTVTLTFEAHRQAQEFVRHHSNRQKAKEIYLNTLAVYAVNFYLRCMGLKTDLEKSQSWNPVMQSLIDVADLELTDVGKIECRRVLPDSQIMEIPAEVWHGRIAYVGVQFNKGLTEATLLGFVKSVETEELAIYSLRSLSDLIENISQIPEPEPVKIPVRLSQWIDNLVETGWQTVEVILGTKLANAAFSFRSGVGTSVKRAKVIDFGIKPLGHQVALVVEFMPSSEDEIEVFASVYAIKEQTYLPENLQLMVLNEDGVPVIEPYPPESTDEFIELEFSVEPGDVFSIKIALGNISITENFQA